MTIVLLTVPVLAQGDADGRDPEFEQEIYDRLAEINPDAVTPFREATLAMDNDDFITANVKYNEVLDLAPDFPDALRRLSYVETRLGNVERGVELARRALSVDDATFNKTALAQALLSLDDSASHQEALGLAQTAVKELPDDDSAQYTLLIAGIVNEDLGAVREASDKLIQMVPDEPMGHFYAGLMAAEDGDWQKAETELIRARELGADPEMVQEILDDGVSGQAQQDRLVRGLLYTVVGWLVGIGVLFVVGSLLSWLTLTAVTRNPSPTQTTGGESFIRSLYRVVIALSSLYFYLSIPFLILIVVAAGGGLLYLIFSVGRVPVRLVAFIAIAVLYTLYAIVRSIFTRVKEQEPGRPLPREDAPALWALTEEVAQRVNTRPVDAIYLTPGTEIAVTEGGGILKKLRGQGHRRLIVGLGVLNGMAQGQFKAIMAHEYGHFSNRDTAGGNLAWQVQLSMRHMAYQLASSGQARWYNPAWLFVNGYYRVFLRITLGASRLQEILADRYAALAYGVQNFAEGLKHVVWRSIAFNMQVNAEVEEAVAQKRILQNLYELPDETEALSNLDEEFERVMNKPTSTYDSHPALKDRIAFLRGVQSPHEGEDSRALIWELLPTAAVLQKTMTAVIQENIRPLRTR
jgi:Zn-dependent protease with chaperone function